MAFTEDNRLNDLYEEIISNPLNVIGNMSYDEYMDWLDMGSEDDLRAALRVFEKNEMPEDYIEIIKIKLKGYA